MCNELCSWVCSRCTTGVNCLVPLHPFSTRCRGKTTNHGCLAAHRRDPTDSYRTQLAKIHGIGKKAKHCRRTTLVYL